MKIRRVVIRNLRSLRERDDTFDREGGGGLADSLCLRGMTGSGKTTYLEVIASIWRLFRRWTQRGTATPLRKPDLLGEADLVAVQFVDLPGPASSLWLVYGSFDQWEAIPREPGDDSAAVLRGPKSGPASSREDTAAAMKSDELLAWWNNAATRQEQPASRGQGEALPNVVYIGAESRVLAPLGVDLLELEQEPSFLWMAHYEPAARKRGHLENSMAALLAVDPERFRAIAARLHAVLPSLRLVDRADPRTRRPLVRLASGVDVTLDALSAGERAVLIALFFVARWMAPGGVVLIDEPELHQHLSLMRSNLAVLDHLVTVEMKGHLLVASHAPEVWDHFRWPRGIVDLDEPSGGASTLAAAQ